MAKRHLGTGASLTAAASLIVDYVLDAAVGVSAGVEAVASAFPAPVRRPVWLCLAALALITAANFWAWPSRPGSSSSPRCWSSSPSQSSSSPGWSGPTSHRPAAATCPA